MTETNLKVAVVGAGAAGLYAVEHLCNALKFNVSIDLFEKLPTPWGLVRSGVAPDHPQKKLIIDRLFKYYLNSPQVQFYGNIAIGKDLSVQQLSSHYDAVIYAMGAGSDIKLNIPGEDLPGCGSAREFVAWYNGHPDYSCLEFDFSSPRAVIIGNGNVAIDVARILTADPDSLAKSDIAEYALDALRQSLVEEVVVVGRRDHLHAAFHNPEIEELEYLDRVDAIFDIKNPRDSYSGISQNQKRKLETIDRINQKNHSDCRKKIRFKFLMSPAKVVGESKVAGIDFFRNYMGCDNQLVRSDEKLSMETGLILKSIGYRGTPFTGLPFDEKKCVIKNNAGRVISDHKVLSGTYVTGWIKRGPKGVIGSNKACAHETVSCLLEDVLQRKIEIKKRPNIALDSKILKRRVDKTAWQKIDHHEIEAGRTSGKPRKKITSRDELLAVAHSGSA